MRSFAESSAVCPVFGSPSAPRCLAAGNRSRDGSQPSRAWIPMSSRST